MSTATIPADPPIGVAGPIPARAYTPDDLLKMEDGVRYELVDGRLVGLNMGWISTRVVGNVVGILWTHCNSPLSAHVHPEHGFTCFPNKPGRMRRPDVSVILDSRLTPESPDEGFTSIRPDLAVEVVSPNDLAEDLEDKLDDYKGAGIPLVWVVYPSIRRIRVVERGEPRASLGTADELTGGDILPGFRCRVSDLFAGLPEGPADLA